METIHHLFITCPFSQQIWHEILSWLRMTCNTPSGENRRVDWWHAAKQNTPKAMQKRTGHCDVVGAMDDLETSQHLSSKERCPPPET
jgi:hypothetical protein